mmetsp:Transcript_30991/g.52541  ORF Transcript_30991/g.52541 Transcript_30991/m.52541 type:complete len:98 (-) Transcript_30991:1133-1426(-)
MVISSTSSKYNINIIMSTLQRQHQTGHISHGHHENLRRSRRMFLGLNDEIGYTADALDACFPCGDYYVHISFSVNKMSLLQRRLGPLITTVASFVPE